MVCISQLCRGEDINENWVKKDSIFIGQVTRAYNEKPLSIEKYLEPLENVRVNLGFGYSVIEHSMGKGYASVFYTCIYKNRKLISYMLSPQMPSDARLTKRYLSFYGSIFNIENNKPQNLYFNCREVSKPIGNIDNQLKVNSQINYFMSPYSGVVYGDYGGIGNEILENRRVFNSVKNSINEDILIYLLKSINPATRLCAAELFYLNREKFKQVKEIEELIKMNLKELPEVETMNGCIQYPEKAKSVLIRMIRKYK